MTTKQRQIRKQMRETMDILVREGEGVSMATLALMAQAYAGERLYADTFTATRPKHSWRWQDRWYTGVCLRRVGDNRKVRLPNGYFNLYASADIGMHNPPYQPEQDRLDAAESRMVDRAERINAVLIHS